MACFSQRKQVLGHPVDKLTSLVTNDNLSATIPEETIIWSVN